MNQEKKFRKMNETGEKQRKIKTNEGKKRETEANEGKLIQQVGKEGWMEGGRKARYLITHSIKPI